jgi:hypothetical protein
MGGLDTRIGRLEAGMRHRHRLGISGEHRKTLTDRAVLHRDLDAIRELAPYRPDGITTSKPQCAAALAAGLRADK